jgi:uncharacterized protein (TIGR02217 family)
MALPQPVLPARSGIVLSPDLADNPDVFPFLRGAGYKQKSWEWSTTDLVSKSGRRFKKRNYSYPTTKFSIGYNSGNGLSQRATRKDLDRLVAFFNARGGQLGDFYYFDAADNLVAGQTLGTGNGVTTQFQLVRSKRTWTEPVFALNGVPEVTVNGIVVTNYTIAAPGVIKFTDAPADGDVVAWSGSFLYWCEFTQDELTAQQLTALLWESDGLSFQTIRL